MPTSILKYETLPETSTYTEIQIAEPGKKSFTEMSFSETVRARRSIRQFLSTPVPQELLRAAFEDAQFSPSNCNTQPWNVHVVSGTALKDLSERILKAHWAGETSPDFSFDMSAFYGHYGERQREQGKSYYESLGVKIDDREGRTKAAAKNYSFFGAPHAAFLFMPTFGDNVRVGGDIGVYAQTLMLALASKGIGSIPQTSLGFYADVVRDALGVSNEYKLLMGISIGYADTNAQPYQVRLGRDPIEKNVTFHTDVPLSNQC